MRQHQSANDLPGAERQGTTRAGRGFDPGTDNRACAEVLRAMADLQPMARRWSLDGATAEDLLQDTAERALRQVGSFAPGSNARAWVRTIMYRLAIDETRRRRRDRTLVARYGPLQPDRCEPEVTCQEAPTEPVTLAEVCRAADRLDPRLRTVFLLATVERLSYRQMSLRLKVPLNTVATRLMRARRQLQAIMRDRQYQ